MKLYCVNDYRDGNGFDSYYFDLEDAEKEAEYIWDHLTDREKAKSEVEIIGYELSIDGYRGTAEKLARELYDGNISCEEFDECWGFDDMAVFYYKNIQKK